MPGLRTIHLPSPPSSFHTTLAALKGESTLQPSSGRCLVSSSIILVSSAQLSPCHPSSPSVSTLCHILGACLNPQSALFPLKGHPQARHP